MKSALYSAPYESSRSYQNTPVDALANDFSELGVQGTGSRPASYLVRANPVFAEKPQSIESDL